MSVVKSTLGVLILVLAGCQPAECPEVDAGGSDVPDVSVNEDVPRDAPAPDGCVVVSPGVLLFAWGYGAFGVTDTRPCPGAIRYYVYSAATGELVWSRTDPTITDCLSGTNLPPGDYDVAVDFGDDRRWLLGGSYLRPEHCDGVRPPPPFCSALRVHVEPCQYVPITTTVFCDPAEGECPMGFPWEGPPP